MTLAQNGMKYRYLHSTGLGRQFAALPGLFLSPGIPSSPCSMLLPHESHELIKPKRPFGDGVKEEEGN